MNTHVPVCLCLAGNLIMPSAFFPVSLAQADFLHGDSPCQQHTRVGGLGTPLRQVPVAGDRTPYLLYQTSGCRGAPISPRLVQLRPQTPTLPTFPPPLITTPWELCFQ